MNQIITSPFLKWFKSTNGDTQKIAAEVMEKGIESPTEQQLPAIISSQYNSIVELEDTVVKSIQLAKDAESSARRASEFTVHWYGGRKEAIELLQDASEYSSKALTSLADAQKKSFEYQTKLTEITKFLFGLGVSSIAMNRCVVRELELKLKGASNEDISDLAKQELKNVILQLKAQESIMQKQEFLTGKVKEHAGQLKEIDKQLEDIEEAGEEQDKLIAIGVEKDKEHDKKILENAQDIDELEKQDEEQDKLIAVGIKKDEEHDERISENAQDIDELQRQGEEQDKKIEEHERAIFEQQEKDEEHDKLIAVGVNKDKEHDVKISENAQDIDELECQNKEQDEKINSLLQQLSAANQKIAELEERLTDFKINKWKIILSISVSASLLLNLLQLFGIL